MVDKCICFPSICCCIDQSSMLLLYKSGQLLCVQAILHVATNSSYPKTVFNSVNRLFLLSQEHCDGVILQPCKTYWLISHSLSLSLCCCRRLVDEAVNRSEDTGMLCFDWQGNPAWLLFWVKVTVSVQQCSTCSFWRWLPNAVSLLWSNHMVSNLSSALSVRGSGFTYWISDKTPGCFVLMWQACCCCGWLVDSFIYSI